jgi:hypothetical protein
VATEEDAADLAGKNSFGPIFYKHLFLVDIYLAGKKKSCQEKSEWTHT